MNFEGAVKSSELPDIFQLLSSSGRSGALVVTRDKVRRKVYFGPDGITLPYDTDQSSRLLGQILVGRGAVSELQLRSALDKQRLSGLPLGEILCNLGAARPDDILAALTYQLREELFDLLTWEHATFEFLEGDLAPASGRSYLRSPSFNTDAIIMEAARRADEWKRIRTAFPSEAAVLLRLPDVEPADNVEYSEALPDLLEMADGTNSVAEMLKWLGRSEFDVYESARQALDAGLVKLASPAELADLAAESLEASQHERAKHLLANASALVGDNLEVHYDLGMLYLWAGLEAEAAAHLDVVLGQLVDESLPAKIEQMLTRVCAEFPAAPYSYERRLKLLNPKKDFRVALPLAAKLLALYKTRGDSQTPRRMLLWLKQFPVDTAEDNVHFAELLESCGDLRGAAHQCLLAAKRYRFAMKRHEAVRLCRKAISLDPRHVAARAELKELMEEPRRKRRMFAALAGLAAAAIVVLVFATRQTAREHAAALDLAATDAAVAELESRGEYGAALAASRDLLERSSGTLIAPAVRQRIEIVQCDAAAFEADRSFSIRTLTESAAAAGAAGKYRLAAERYDKLAELTGPGSAHDAAAASAAFMRNLDSVKR